MFKKGDRVRIKWHPFSSCGESHCASMSEDMAKQIGKFRTIKGKLAEERYHIDGSLYWWSDCMLEPVPTISWEIK